MSKKVPLLKATVWELCLRFFSSVFNFCKIKGYYYWKHNFCRLYIWNPASWLLQISQKSNKWQWRHDFRHDVNVNLFWRCFVSLVKFSCWSKFHVNVITGSKIVTIFFYKGLTRNSEIGNIPVWVLPNVWRLGRAMNTKLGMNVSNRMLLDAAKLQGCNFYRFWVIKEKPTGGIKLPASPPDPD